MMLRSCIRMEIPKLNVKVKENEVKVENTLSIKPISNDLVSQVSDQLMLDLPIAKIEDEGNFLLNFKPLSLFDSLEEEYAKVKDFDFNKVDVKDISKFVRVL